VIPRRDPDTRPVASGVQLVRRCAQDAYGIERKAKERFQRVRPVQTRNGLPVKHYDNWRQSRPSMTPDEAEAWLVWRYRSPGGIS
jgi:hypothetical protein